jgi:DNA-binding transcriptional ArsR family regulator
MILRHMLNYHDGLDRMFHALADPARRAIVARLSRGSASVSELAKPLPMSLPSVIQHLQVLEASGLVRSQKQGRVRTCHIEADVLKVAEEWLARQRAVWEGRLDRLEAYLHELQAKEKGRDDGGDD